MSSGRRDYAAAASKQQQQQPSSTAANQRAQQQPASANRKSNAGVAKSTAAGSTAATTTGTAVSSGPTPLSADLAADMGDRLLLLLANLVGAKVQVQVTTGLLYEGIFHAAQSDQDMGVILRMAQKITPSKDGSIATNRLTAESVIPYLIIQSKDLVQITATDVEMGFALDRAPASLTDRRGFETDTGISGHSGQVQERNLERWLPDGGTDLLTLESNHNGEWDQFATNEKLFGVTTDFDEEIYTTKLDKNSAEYKRREKEAARLAQQIEKAAANNVHLAEERGLAVDDSQMDEEDRYGAVVRKPGAYLPPALRKKQEAEAAASKSTQPSPATAPADVKTAEKAPDAQAAREPTTATPDSSQPPKTTKLNPNASSFKFNLSASSFTPSFEPSKPAATSTPPPQTTSHTQQKSPPRRQEYNNQRPSYVFGKALSRGALSIKALLLENFKRSLKHLDTPESLALSEFWPFGQFSYSEIAGPAPELMPPGVMYGYPAYPNAYPAPGPPRAAFMPPTPVPYMPPPVYAPFPGMPPPPGGMPIPMPVIPGYPAYPGAYGMPMPPPDVNGGRP